MGGFLGDLPLAYLFSIALGGLIVLTFMAAFARLYWKKRRLAQYQLKQDLEAAEKATQKAVMKKRVLGEGDLFGVRAIERGYYGGVAQSAQTSAATSPRLSPILSVYGDGDPIMMGHSAHNSIPEFSLGESGLSPGPSSHRQSVRLLPSDAELNGRRNHDPAVHAYAPTSPKRVSPPIMPLANQLSAHGKPTPMTLSQVPSYAQWKLSQGHRQRPRSKSGTRMSGEAAPRRGRFPTQPLTPGRRKSKSVSSVDELAHLQVLHEKYLGDGSVNPPPLQKQAVLTRFPVIPVPTYTATNSTVDSTARLSRSRNPSRESTTDRRRQNSSSSSNRNPAGTCESAANRTRQTSSDSNKSLRRTRDSIRHTRKASADSEGRRRSRQRDTLHWDPSNHHRTVSGSVIGRTVNFDKPRSTPFDDPEDVSPESSPDYSVGSDSSPSGSRSRSRSHSRSGRSRSSTSDYVAPEMPIMKIQEMI